MPVHSRRYFQMVEKDSAKISPLWKASHALIFILIVIVSFCSAFTFHDIFDSFNFRCILYGKPSVHLQDIVYNITKTTVATTPLTPTENISTLTPITPKTLETAALVNRLELPKNKEPPKKETLKIETIGDEFWVSNSTLRARVTLYHKKTVYGSKGMCNAILFFPLATLIFGTFAAVIVIICGRGGRGYKTDLFPQPWLYVYPLLILSVIMLIINSVLATWLSRGMHQFCSGFKEYTGQESCSEQMKFFFDEKKFGSFNLLYMHNLCILSFYTEIILWALQVALIVMRVLCIVDFQLVMVTVSCKRRRSLEYEDDPVSRILMNSYRDMKKVVSVGEHYYHEKTEKTQVPRPLDVKKGSRKKVTFSDEHATSEDESSKSSKAHQVLTKLHKLKKVSFHDKKDTKKDKDDDVTQV